MIDLEPKLRTKRANWQAAILVCRKCERKLGDSGFGPFGRLRLAKALRRALKALTAPTGRKLKGRAAPAGVLEVGCQKLCPRGGVTVIVGAQPNAWLIANPGASIEALLALAGVRLGAD
jgi:hypothetical protein